MNPPFARAIDCDAHVSVPSVRVLLPYLDAYWRQQFLTRGIDKLSWNLTSDPPNAPISGRPDWRPKEGKPGASFDLLKAQALDGFGQTLFGSDIYKIDVGLPKDPLFLLESVFDGGVLVNTDSQVLDWDKHPIPNLYAAGLSMMGSMCGGTENSAGAYVGYQAVCLIFALLAAEAVTRR